VEQRIAPSVQIEAAIEAALTGGLVDPDALSTLGRLVTRLGMSVARDAALGWDVEIDYWWRSVPWLDAR
jgi:hypothetical protein